MLSKSYKLKFDLINIKRYCEIILMTYQIKANILFQKLPKRVILYTVKRFPTNREQLKKNNDKIYKETIHRF